MRLVTHWEMGQGPRRCVVKAADFRPGKGITVSTKDTGKWRAAPRGLSGREGSLLKDSLREMIDKKGLG